MPHSLIRKCHTLLLSTLVILLSGCQAFAPTPDHALPVLYTNGPIITMEGPQAEYAEALVTHDGKIQYVGSLQGAKAAASEHTLFDLKGNTLLPGFIDSHSHFSMVINAIGQANLSPPPVGTVTNFAELIANLKAYAQTFDIQRGEWIFAWGYDENQLEEKRHISKHELDAAFPENPVYLQHVSGHLGIANSMALALGNINSETPDPVGGKIIRMPNSQEPTGEVQEVAIYYFAGNAIKTFIPKKNALFPMAQDYYLKHGITTAQDGMTDPLNMAFFQQIAQQKKLVLDLVTVHGYQAMKGNDYGFGTYQNGLKPQGIKLIVDGSPQGKTAFFTTPYQTEVAGCRKNCRGYPHMLQEVLDSQFIEAYEKGYQLFIHGNGDAAIDMILQAHINASERLDQALDADRRTVVIHSQFVRQDQLDAFKRYNIMPSFFTNHTYFWGDVHVENLGSERAYFMSPMRAASDMGLVYTNHSDETVTPINPLFGIHTAVNRSSRSGKVIGAQQRVSPYVALKAVTLNAAHQIFEEANKGSLKPGKIADLVVLNGNPLAMPERDLKNIRVIRTIKRGDVVFSGE